VIGRHYSPNEFGVNKHNDTLNKIHKESEKIKNGEHLNGLKKQLIAKTKLATKLAEELEHAKAEYRKKVAEVESLVAGSMSADAKLQIESVRALLEEEERIVLRKESWPGEIMDNYELKSVALRWPYADKKDWYMRYERGNSEHSLARLSRELSGDTSRPNLKGFESKVPKKSFEEYKEYINDVFLANANAGKPEQDDVVEKIKAVYEKTCQKKVDYYNSQEAKQNTEAKRLRNQADEWRTTGKCPHCGGKMGFLGKCKICKESSAAPVKFEIPAVIPDDIPYGIINFGGFEWQVLDIQESKALLLCKVVVDLKSYADKTGRLGRGHEWDHADWLNDTFKSKFKDWEKAMVSDEISLFHFKEVARYFGKSRQIEKISGHFTWISNRKIDDEFNYRRIACTKSGDACDWWLATSGLDTSSRIPSPTYVDKNGEIIMVMEVDNQKRGIRPAMWINLNNIDRQ